MLDSTMIFIFLPLLFIVAFLYASVGHGGASGYLALMALFSFDAAIMKSSSLILNIFVSLVSFYQYNKGGHFRWKLFLPFAISSIPASFIGASITLDSDMYKKLLGLLLIFPIFSLLGIIGKESESIKEVKWPLALLMGAVIGLLSGMIGIGGGILLSPLILLLHWADMKQTAAISALFIFVNSISGLAGLLIKNITIDHHIYLWVLFALAGGLTGAYVGRKQLSNKTLKALLAFVLVIASVKLLIPEKNG